MKDGKLRLVKRFSGRKRPETRRRNVISGKAATMNERENQTQRKYERAPTRKKVSP